MLGHSGIHSDREPDTERNGELPVHLSGLHSHAYSGRGNQLYMERRGYIHGNKHCDSNTCHHHHLYGDRNIPRMLSNGHLNCDCKHRVIC